MIHHLLGAAVHGDVGDHHQVLRRARCPLLVEVDDECRPIVELPVAGGDDLHVVALEFFKVLLDLIPERSHDLGEVALGRFLGSALVGDVEIGGGDVRPQEVAAEQDPVFFEVGDHGFRPVHPGCVDERESLASQCQLFAIAHGDECLLRDGKKIDEDVFSLGCAHHFGVRVFLEHQPDAAGVILFGVMRDDVVDLGHVCQLLHQRFRHCRIDRVEQGDFVLALNEIRVV